MNCGQPGPIVRLAPTAFNDDEGAPRCRRPSDDPDIASYDNAVSNIGSDDYEDDSWADITGNLLVQAVSVVAVLESETVSASVPQAKTMLIIVNFCGLFPPLESLCRHCDESSVIALTCRFIFKFHDQRYHLVIIGESAPDPFFGNLRISCASVGRYLYELGCAEDLR